MTESHFRAKFVKYVPHTREEGVIYVSFEFKTAVHSCACGCGNKVVTPINPAQWRLGWTGDNVSLSPSIGNWQFPCRSHYCITDGHVRWAAPWSERQVLAGRARDRADVTKYLDERAAGSSTVGAGKESFASRLRRALHR